MQRRLEGIHFLQAFGAVWRGMLAKQKIKQRQLHQAFF
jgi:hypothetical protein